MIVPAAPMSAFTYTPSHKPAAPKLPFYKTLNFRQTVIPILLTCGVMLLVMASLKFVVNPDSPLAALPGWMPVVLVVIAAGLLAVAVLNMLQVRQQLAGRR